MTAPPADPEHVSSSALVLGVTGQDGAFLARLLLSKGYVVHGVRRRSSSFNTHRVDDMYVDPREHSTPFLLHYGDLTDPTNLVRLIQLTRPSEIYNLAAQSHVAVSFETPEYTANADALGPLRLLEAIRILGMTGQVKFVQASTSEMFGDQAPVPQNEGTPFKPCSPYAIAKLYAHWITVNYREAYGIHASTAIMFNHESAWRGETFVTRKITRAVAAIERREQSTLFLGNLDARRDWGHAKDYVEAMWRIAQHSVPDDYVIATGESHSVREFVELAFAVVGRTIEWSGTGIDEVGRCAKSSQVLVRVDPSHFRPLDPHHLCGDAGKARSLLGWRPRTTFLELVSEMVTADLADLPAPPARSSSPYYSKVR